LWVDEAADRQLRVRRGEVVLAPLVRHGHPECAGWVDSRLDRGRFHSQRHRREPAGCPSRLR
jgi:hypothetical protein